MNRKCASALFLATSLAIMGPGWVCAQSGDTGPAAST